MMNSVVRAAFALALMATIADVAAAQTTTTYTYDALGRVVTSTNSASNLQSTYKYDPADNRTNLTVAAPGGGGAQPPVCANKTLSMGTINNGGAGVTTGAINVLTYAPACTDAQGYALSVTSISGFTNSATGTLSSPNVTVNNVLPGGTVFTFAVSDGQGNTIYPTFKITRN